MAAGTDVLLSAQGMNTAMIARGHVHRPRSSPRCEPGTSTPTDSTRSDSSTPAGGRRARHRAARRAIKQIALVRPGDYWLPFSTWSLSKLADYLVAQGVVEDISHEGLRMLLRDEGVSFPGREDLEEQ